MLAELTGTPTKTGMVRERIAREIRAGILPPGTRMLGMRELAARFNVSFAVINSAYDELERDGLIVRKARSGAMVNPGLRPPKTRMLALITSYGRHDIENYYEPLFAIASQRRVIPMVAAINSDSDWQRSIADLIARQPDGLIIDLEAKHYPLGELLGVIDGIPYCFFNRWEWFPEQPDSVDRAILTDYSGAYATALIELQQRGHRRIAVAVNHASPRPYMEEFLRRAFADAGLDQASCSVRISRDEVIDHPETVDRMIAVSGATALMATGDFLAETIRTRCPAAAKLETFGFFNTVHSQREGREFHSFDLNFDRMWNAAIDSFDQSRDNIQYLQPQMIIRNHVT